MGRQRKKDALGGAAFLFGAFECGLLPKGALRLCRGGSRSSTYPEVIHGLSSFLLLAEFFERRGAWAPSPRDSGQIVGFAHPALKRGASKHCPYGAGAEAGARDELPLARR